MFRDLNITFAGEIIEKIWIFFKKKSKSKISCFTNVTVFQKNSECLTIGLDLHFKLILFYFVCKTWKRAIYKYRNNYSDWYIFVFFSALKVNYVKFPRIKFYLKQECKMFTNANDDETSSFSIELRKGRKIKFITISISF